MKIEIKTFSGRVLYSCEALSVKECLELAVQDRADLGDAHLVGADLSGAYLVGAYLVGAYFGRANLVGADLSGAYLDKAHFGGADLSGAYLVGAYLVGAYFGGAYFNGAYFGGKIKIKKQPLRIDTVDYYVIIFDDHIKIGCEFHSINDWFSFDNKRIAEMDGKQALSFWKKWKPAIHAACVAGGRV